MRTTLLTLAALAGLLGTGHAFAAPRAQAPLPLVQTIQYYGGGYAGDVQYYGGRDWREREEWRRREWERHRRWVEEHRFHREYDRW